MILPVFKVIKTYCSWKTRVWQFQLLWKSKTCNLVTKKRHLSISSQAGLLLHSKVYHLYNWQERIIRRLQSSNCAWFILPLLSLAGVYELRCVTKDEKQENYNEIHNSKPWKLDGFGWTCRSCRLSAHWWNLIEIEMNVLTFKHFIMKSIYFIHLGSWMFIGSISSCIHTSNLLKKLGI